MHYKTERAQAMTFVEVLVALVIVAAVFTALIQMTFDALKRAKTLELQDKMRNYATEAVQIVYNTKDTKWDELFGDTGLLRDVNNQAYIVYQPGQEPFVKSVSTGQCGFDETANRLSGSSCDDTSGNEDPNEPAYHMFGRIIKRTAPYGGISPNSNTASLEIIVACISTKCDPTQYKPFKLTLDVYQTSVPR